MVVNNKAKTTRKEPPGATGKEKESTSLKETTASALPSTADDPAIKAAARAYALSGSGSGKANKQSKTQPPQRKAAGGRQEYSAQQVATATQVPLPARPTLAPTTATHTAATATRKSQPSLPMIYGGPRPVVGNVNVRLPTTVPAAAAARQFPAISTTSVAHNHNHHSAPQPLRLVTGNVNSRTMGIPPCHASVEPLPLVPLGAGGTSSMGRGHVNIPVVDETDLDDYARFVKSLGLDDDWKLRDDDDEEEFLLEAMEDDDDDDDDDDGDGDESGGEDVDDDDQAAPKTIPETQHTKDVSKEPSASAAMDFDLLDWDPDFYQELEEELGGLEEEDMEAAVATLLDHTKKRNDAGEVEITPASEPIGGGGGGGGGTSSKTDTTGGGEKAPKSASSTSAADPQGPSPNTPLRDAARASRTVVTTEQFDQLHSLMNEHYQLLTQQAVLSVRAAHFSKTHKSRDQTDFVTGGETGDDLVEILDGAVGMLQDLDQNRKDSIRNSIQFDTAHTAPARRSLLSEMVASEESINQSTTGTGERRLTRAQFIKTLQKHTNGQQRTVFDIQGLSRLKETFAMVDKSVEGVRKGNPDHNILEMSSNAEACRQVLDKAEAVYDKNALPGVRDAAVNFCDAKEFLGPKFVSPCTPEQDLILRRNRNLFTSGEDNLVFRGVNLYGEKQWILIADRYLPDRSINIISQRYSKLCVMLYKAHNIEIDENGNLTQPPRLESVDDLDEAKVGTFLKVAPPAILNVHRWSLEEDLTLLIAVPHMGHMWAELGARLIPHRDRGHLRKRYQVLERRVKASVSRTNKHESATKLAAKYGSPIKSPLKSPAKAGRPAVVKPPAPVRSLPLASAVNSSSKTVNQAAAILANTKMAPTKPLPPTKRVAQFSPYNPQRSLIQPPPKLLPPKRTTPQPAQKPLLPQSSQSTQKPLPLPPQRPTQQPTLKPKPQPTLKPKPQPTLKQKPQPTLKQKPQPKQTPRHSPQPQAQHTRPPHQQPHPPQLPYQPQYPHQPHHPHQMYHYPQDTESYRMQHSFSVGPAGPPPAHPQPYPNQALDHHNEGGSRQAFEDLVQGYTGDAGDSNWSQMSRMQKMMENDTESMVANAIVTQLAKSPAKPLKERGAFSGNFGDNDDDNNGFSMLDTYGSSPAKPPRAEGGSFFDGVLERTRQADPPRTFPAGEPGDASRIKPPPAGASDTSRATVPSTPNRRITFSNSTTPIGLSPGFRPGGIMLPPSASKYTRSPGLSVDSFTAGAVSKMLADSPAANSSNGANSMVGYNLSGMFDLSDHSQQASDGGDGTPRPSPRKTPNRPLFGDNATLMENDLEAISALNSLSNSPSHPLLKRPASSQDNRPENEIEGGGESRQSLFATVIGGVKEKESRKKRLKF